MLGFLVFVLGVLVVAGLLFLGASWLLGRGESRPPAEVDRSPVELPADRPVTGEDLRGLQISVAVRGYRMSEVDWLIEQFAAALEERDAQLAVLRQRAHPAPGLPPKESENPTTPELVVPPPDPRPDDEETPHA